MALSPLTHRKLAPVSATQTVASVLDALYDSLTATNWYDGAVRSVGIKVKNVTKYQNSGRTEAVYGEFAGSDMTNVKFLFGGQDAVNVGFPKTVPRRTPDDAAGTITAGHIFCQIVRNAGVFTQWDSSTPFTSGQAFNYWKCAVGTNVTHVECYESQDTLWVVFNGTASSTVYACGLGALWDPDSTSGTTSELSGRRIGVITTGTNTMLARPSSQGGFLSGPDGYIGNTATQVFLDHNTTDGEYHCGVLNVPTLSSITTCVRDSYMRPANDPSGGNGAWISTGTLDSGRVVRRMLGCHLLGAGGAVGANSQNTLGKLRDISCHPLARSGSVLADAGTDVAYAIGVHHISVGNVILLHY